MVSYRQPFNNKSTSKVGFDIGFSSLSSGEQEKSKNNIGKKNNFFI